MSYADFFQIFLFFNCFILLTPLLGIYLAKVFSGNKTFLHAPLGWMENVSYRLGAIDPSKEMGWKEYTKAMLLFNFIGFLVVFLIQIFQNYLPLNPQNLPNVPWQLAFNSAASYATNTNWQSYAGETTLSYFTQMIGLTVQNFLSAGTGCAVLLVLIRGLTRKTTENIGNYWVDLVRSVVYILIPLSLLFALFLISQGVIQNFSEYVKATTLEGVEQTIPMGPVASQIAIKQLGTNGGGFFNANSAHPFENPTGLSNFFEMSAILLIPAALVFTFGHLIGSKRHGWLLFFVMLLIWGIDLFIGMYFENSINPILDASPALEGKETRFGITNSILWAVSTTGTSNGSINAMHSSLSPLAGGIALFNIMLGELIFGGIGVGLCSMIMFVILTVFLSGLMVGRTPEYLGKKIEKREIQWVIVAILFPGISILIGAGISSVLPDAVSSLANQGPHGLSEILYAFSSASGNNGSAFAGLNANTNYYNIFLGIIMLLTRLSILVPSVALAGSLARKKISPPSIGTFSTNSTLFAILLIAVILIVGALTFFPALTLGPIAEHLLMLKERTF